MDFLNPKKRRRHYIQLYVGYVLVAIAIGLGVFILLLVAFGFGVGKNGQIVQKGFVFVASRPGGANISLDGGSVGTTGARLNLVSGKYDLQLTRSGYRTWQKQINVIGGRVLRIDYPLLFPAELTTITVQNYSQKPPLVTSTPDSHWLMVLHQSKLDSTRLVFDQYDMTKPDSPPAELNLPSNLYASSPSPHNDWQLIEWSNDGNYMLLKHSWNDKSKHEFILYNWTQPNRSINLNSWFGREYNDVRLVNGSSDQFYLYNHQTRELATATLENTTPVQIAGDVITYSPYSNSNVAYISRTGKKGPAWLQLERGGATSLLRRLPVSRHYHLAAGEFQGNTYLAVSASKLKAAYVYKNPAKQISSNNHVLSAMTFLQVKQPDWLDFGPGNRMLVAEKGSHFATYDLLYKHNYRFNTKARLDKNQKSATWLDGTHLQYVSGGQLLAFDFDGLNKQKLMPATSNLNVNYSQNQADVYSLVPAKKVTGGFDLTMTYLRTPGDR